MGKSFKLNNSKKPVKEKEKEKEIKKVYDHTPKVIINKDGLKDLSKNMDKPSKLWDDQ